MTSDHYLNGQFLRGEVYIFENAEAKRVKVGMTISDVKLRLRDVNDMWLEYKLSCQICGTRRLAKLVGLAPRLMPRHGNCPGGGALPLEADLTLAKSHLEDLIGRSGTASGSEKASLTRRIQTLKKRIELRPQHNRAVGMWRIDSLYYTDSPEILESRAHEILNAHLDAVAPLGEVFCCTVNEAREAVERVLNHLGLPHVIRRRTPESQGSTS